MWNDLVGCGPRAGLLLQPGERAEIFRQWLGQVELNTLADPHRKCFEMPGGELVEIGARVRTPGRRSEIEGFDLTLFEPESLRYQAFNFSAEGKLEGAVVGVRMRTRDGIGSSLLSSQPELSRADKLLRSLSSGVEFDPLQQSEFVESAVTAVDAGRIFKLLLARGPLSVSQIVAEELLSVEAVGAALEKLVKDGHIATRTQEPHQVEGNPLTTIYGIKL